MFEKILIANRGEIACRVATTAKRLGIKTVAVYSDADANSKHVEVCDEAVHIGSSSVKESYLQWQKILQAAKQTGAQAIHPGYGFLSENEAFAKACTEAGLVFIGPHPHSIQAMGLKAESKQLMQKAGVPLVPGYHGKDQHPDLLKKEADAIGYPVLIKASAGGGGKGMRLVESPDDFLEALASCQREARNSFGDDAVLVEKYVQRPRHIEIQIFGDSHGNIVYLYERDCSVQRRHQKVLEEAPAPGMSQALREQMGAAAVAAAKAVQYVGAGTVEFIVEQQAYDQPEKMNFYFMEMNTRLQVEHPVTEAITQLDLVEWQLRVAAGQPIPLQQHQICCQGHAIEARICAENPDNQFLPATGKLLTYRKPAASAFLTSPVRIDDGVRQGDEISPYYDSMIAKLIVHGETRQHALSLLDKALSQLHIVGLANNVQFLRHVLATRSFKQPLLDTALIEREKDQLFHQQAIPFELATAAMVAHQLQQATVTSNNPGHWQDPFTQADGFQAHAQSVRFFKILSGEKNILAQFDYSKTVNQGNLSIQIDNSNISAVLQWAASNKTDSNESECEFFWQGQIYRAEIYKHKEQIYIFMNQGFIQLGLIDELTHAGESQSHAGRLTAPMPGKILSFAVSAGDTVKQGQILAVIEAMKMEHTIQAPSAGKVSQLLFAPGDQVTEGAELLRLEV
jgi:3-methylcrotonyl-CoA carboxylase alpha subunit